VTGDRPALDVAGDFGDVGGRAWLNRAHQGPLPVAAARVDVALRRGRLRVSPHLDNTEADLDRALEVLGRRTAPVESR